MVIDWYDEIEEGFGTKTIRRVCKTASRKSVDKSVRQNASNASTAGLQTTVVRKYDGIGLHNGNDTCKWCVDRSGTWNYNECYANGVFERHPGCGCEIIYNCQRMSHIQTDWTSNTWEVVQNRDVVLSRRTYGTERNRMQLFSKKVTNLRNEYVGRSVSAKFENYDIIDLITGEKYHLAEDSRLQNKKVFAGKGTKTPYRDAWKYVEKFPETTEEDWQHVKGYGLVTTPDGDFDAEIHWSQCEGIGKVDLFIKRWIE